MTYFNNNKNSIIISDSLSKITGYDRLHNVPPYDYTKTRCDRSKPSKIWNEIYKENIHHTVPMITSHWYGRPNRVQVDFPDNKFKKSNKMRDNFYRRNGTNLSSIMDRQLPE